MIGMRSQRNMNLSPWQIETTCYNNCMITVYSVKDFDRIVKNAVQWAIEQKIDRTDTKVAANMANRFKNSAKAHKQLRGKDGRFVKPGLHITIQCKKCGNDPYDCTCTSEPAPKPHTVEKNPLVSFYYPMSNTPWNSRKRLVRLISSTGTHFTGLEQQHDGGFKFKKYLAPKATEFKVLEFNPQAMSWASGKLHQLFIPSLLVRSAVAR